MLTCCLHQSVGTLHMGLMVMWSCGGRTRRSAGPAGARMVRGCAPNTACVDMHSHALVICTQVTQTAMPQRQKPLIHMRDSQLLSSEGGGTVVHTVSRPELSAIPPLAEL